MEKTLCAATFGARAGRDLYRLQACSFWRPRCVILRTGGFALVRRWIQTPSVAKVRSATMRRGRSSSELPLRPAFAGMAKTGRSGETGAPAKTGRSGETGAPAKPAHPPHGIASDALAARLCRDGNGGPVGRNGNLKTTSFSTTAGRASGSLVDGDARMPCSRAARTSLRALATRATDVVAEAPRSLAAAG